MDKHMPTENEQQRLITGLNASCEIGLQSLNRRGKLKKLAENGANKHPVDSGQKKNGYSKLMASESQSPVKPVAKRRTRKEKSLENWALNEEDPSMSKCWPCCWNGSLDSVGCPLASPGDIYDILHHTRLVLGAYGRDVDDLEKLIKEEDPKFSKKVVIRFEHPTVGQHNCPPFFICVDHRRREVALYMRGLNLHDKGDYLALMTNRKQEKLFKGGYLHKGIGHAANWCLGHIGSDLKEQLLKHEGYRLTLVGHSLGAGVCAVLAALIVEDRDVVGGIDCDLIRAYAIGPPRVLSLNLATRYARNIYSVIYQDDFLPRISTSSVKKVFVAAFALTGVVLFLCWLKQAMKKRSPLDDIYRLYPPGQIFHVIYRQPGVAHKMPIQVRVVDSVQGRFERILLTSSGTAMDHSILKLARHLKTYDWPPEFRNVI